MSSTQRRPQQSPTSGASAFDFGVGVAIFGGTAAVASGMLGEGLRVVGLALGGIFVAGVVVEFVKAWPTSSRLQPPGAAQPRDSGRTALLAELQRVGASLRAQSQQLQEGIAVLRDVSEASQQQRRGFLDGLLRRESPEDDLAPLAARLEAALRACRADSAALAALIARIEAAERAERAAAEAQAAQAAGPAGSSGAAAPAAAEVALEECRVCLEGMVRDEREALGACGHAFHAECLRGHAMALLGEARLPIRCPLPECGAEVDQRELLTRYLRAPEDRRRYDQVVVMQSVPEAERWTCSQPGCYYMMAVGAGEQRPSRVRCSLCRRDSCARCSVPWHDGMNCEQWAARQRERERDNGAAGRLATAAALARVTKPCPRCNNAIEKSGGCDHMTCRCGHEFIWTCLCDYRGPNSHPMGRPCPRQRARDGGCSIQ
eukprot:tig00021350_g20629.t1